jgi:hypothetical protein
MLFVCSYEDLMFGSDDGDSDDDDETSFSRKVNPYSIDLCCRKKCPESLKATMVPKIISQNILVLVVMLICVDFSALIFKDQKSKKNPVSKAFIRENKPDEPLDLLSSSISQHVTGVYI